jgi:hypothetical protein
MSEYKVFINFISILALIYYWLNKPLKNNLILLSSMNWSVCKPNEVPKANLSLIIDDEFVELLIDLLNSRSSTNNLLYVIIGAQFARIEE